jgi:O-antigen/teichoic acid export membrane protein
VDDQDGKAEYLSEILAKGSMSMMSFLYRRLAMAIFSFLTTSYIGTSIYGYISVMIRLEVTFMMLCLRTSTANVRTLPRLGREDTNRISTLSFLISMLLFVVVSGFLVIFTGEIINNTLLLPKHTILLQLTILALLPIAIISYVSTIYKSKKNIKASIVLTQSIRPTCYIISSVATILLLSDSAVSIWISVIILFIFFSLISIYYVTKEISFTTDIKLKSEIVLDYLGYSAYSSGISVLSIFHRDIVFIIMSVFLNPVSAGLFSLSLILARTSRWALTGVNQIFPPIATELYNDNRTKTLNDLYKSTSKIATTISTIPVVFAVAYHEEIMSIFSPEYASESIVLVIALVAQVSSTLIGSVGLLLMMTDNQELSTYVSLSNVILMIPISIYMTAQYGIIGLSLSFLFTMSYNNIMELIVLYKYEGLNPFTRYHLYIILICAINSLISIKLSSLIGNIGGIIASFALSISIDLISYKYFLADYEKMAIDSILEKYIRT